MKVLKALIVWWLWRHCFMWGKWFITCTTAVSTIIPHTLTKMTCFHCRVQAGLTALPHFCFANANCHPEEGKKKKTSQLSVFDIHQTLAGRLLRTGQSFPHGSRLKPRTFQSRVLIHRKLRVSSSAGTVLLQSGVLDF